jgi:hypothetical protein
MGHWRACNYPHHWHQKRIAEMATNDHPKTQEVREALAYFHATTGRTDLTATIEAYINWQREKLTELASRIITLEEKIIATPPENTWQRRFWKWLHAPKGTDV